MTTPSGTLAVDLGLRCGLAFFESNGTLLRLSARQTTSLYDFQPFSEFPGSGDPIDVGLSAGVGATLVHPSPERWRGDMLLPREQLNSASAKAAARVLAQKIISERAGRGAPKFSTDTAEAICLGYWAISAAP